MKTEDLYRPVVGEDRCPACGTSVPAIIIGPNVVDMPYDSDDNEPWRP